MDGVARRRLPGPRRRRRRPAAPGVAPRAAAGPSGDAVARGAASGEGIDHVPERIDGGGYGFGHQVLHDDRFGTIVGHSGGLPGYGSNMRWLPGRRVGVGGPGQLDLRPDAAAARRMLEVLDDHGLVPPVALPLRRRSRTPPSARGAAPGLERRRRRRAVRRQRRPRRVPTTVAPRRPRRSSASTGPDRGRFVRDGDGGDDPSPAGGRRAWST